MDKRQWLSASTPAQPDPDLSRKDRRSLEMDVQYWKASSKRKDNDISYLNNQIRGFKSQITRLKAALYKKGGKQS
ncbi:hypothetical protein N180_02995 [Pedobacter antarcticus 4BY]|uniref:Uncharacterized protein n=1 Tax=Pedobacter antarcticus 4BY TaxID=1358423 RepID=A0A081PKK7_9SPHI|nr:hypothetical protein [Pedobacter antarcticus]KEQ31230.1 hypothetical protein N180_02995 [Pedobacter antarcticus 4BY]